MAENTSIEWTDATWNPITGCTLVSEGCRHCYAATLAATRLKHHPSRKGLARVNAHGEAKFTGEVRFNEQWLDQPLRWTRPRRVFVCAHGDLFHESVPDEWIDRVFAVMALAPQHTFQVLTKRPERAREYMSHLDAPIYWNHLAIASRKGRVALLGDMSFLRGHALGPLPNVWLGTSVEDQTTADARIPHLLATPAAVAFLSAEPLLGPITIDPAALALIDWVIVGGESGRNARPMHPDWARSLRDQCHAEGVAFFFKQWGEFVPVTTDCDETGTVCQEDGCGDLAPFSSCEKFPVQQAHQREFWRIGKSRAGRLLDGRVWDEMPAVDSEAASA